MARETKVGLLIALGVILLIGVIISDHLAVTQPQQAQANTAAAVANFAPAAQQGIQPNPTPQRAQPLGGSVQSQPQPTPGRAAPRLIAPDRFADPTLGPPDRQIPDTQAAQATPSPLAELPSPPTAWRKVETLTTPPTRSQAQAQAQRQTPINTPSLTAPAPVREAGSEFLHDVTRQDTLASVALKYYNDSAYAASLAAANPTALNPDGTLRQGTRLVIPNRSGHIPAPPTPGQAAAKTTLTPDSPTSTPTLAQRDTAPDARANEPPTALMSTGLFVPATGPSASGQAPDALLPITAQANLQAQRDAQQRAADQAARTITVQPGDSLSKLAERHLGSQAQYLALFEANRDVLESPDKVVVGMKLMLPEAATSTTPDPTPQPSDIPTPPARPAAETYTVQTGDNLSRIAEKTLGSRDRWNDLYQANRDRLETPDRVKVGQELRIPN